jgi:hypothetical protein
MVSTFSMEGILPEGSSSQFSALAGWLVVAIGVVLVLLM